jgi:hypothetical protein
MVRSHIHFFKWEVINLFSGGHSEVAEFLLQICKAELMDFTVERYPEFTAQLVHKIFQPVDQSSDNETVRIYVYHK